MITPPRALLALLAILTAPAAWADTPADQWGALANLVGHSKADVLRRLGPPNDRSITVDGERLFYEKIDAGRFGARSGQGARDDSGDTGLSLRDYDFRCRTEIVIRNDRMQAFNRTGSDCRR